MGEVGGQHRKEKDYDGQEVDPSCEQDHEVIGETKMLMKSVNVIWRVKSLFWKRGEVEPVEAEDIAPIGNWLLEHCDLCVLQERQVAKLNQGGQLQSYELAEDASQCHNTQVGAK